MGISRLSPIRRGGNLVKPQYFFKGEEIEFEVVDERIKRKVVAHGGDMMIVEVHFKKGAVGGQLHTHMHEQTSYCIKGSLEFIVDGQKQIIEAGDSIYMPPHSYHGCNVLEDDTVLLDVFTPQRLDFLATKA